MTSSRMLAVLALLSGLLAAAVFQVQGRTGFNLADEGFLWYGVQRVMLGEVPLRDFMAYDPARYYWSAAFMSLLSDNGIVALRQSVAVFQWLGLFIALALAAALPQRANPLRFALWAAILMLWMYPRHKLFDISWSIFLVAVLACLLAAPSRRRYFLAGLAVGAAALFGRNHGVYGAAGSLLAIACLHLGGGDVKRLARACGWWLAGVIAGYLPMLLLCLLAPGYASALSDSIRFLFEFKATNLPLPVPWPWRADFSGADPAGTVRGIITGLFFIALPAFGILGVAAALRARWQGRPLQPLTVAAACMALPYAHYAFSRADIGHLALGIFPLLLGLLSLLAARSRRTELAGAACLLAASLAVMLPAHPGWQARQDANWLQARVGNDVLAVDPGTADNLVLLATLVQRLAPGERTFMAAPLWPGAYAAFGRRSPVWEIYPVVPRSPQFQREEIERIRRNRPGFVLIIDFAQDGRDDLRYRNTFPLVEQYIRANYQPVADAAIPGQVHVYQERAAAGSAR